MLDPGPPADPQPAPSMQIHPCARYACLGWVTAAALFAAAPSAVPAAAAAVLAAVLAAAAAAPAAARLAVAPALQH